MHRVQMPAQVQLQMVVTVQMQWGVQVQPLGMLKQKDQQQALLTFQTQALEEKIPQSAARATEVKMREQVVPWKRMVHWVLVIVLDQEVRIQGHD